MKKEKDSPASWSRFAGVFFTIMSAIIMYATRLQAEFKNYRVEHHLPDIEHSFLGISYSSPASVSISDLSNVRYWLRLNYFIINAFNLSLIRKNSI